KQTETHHDNFLVLRGHMISHPRGFQFPMCGLRSSLCRFPSEGGEHIRRDVCRFKKEGYCVIS
ncbi:hypothetical protein, partial [Pyramidobacter porci]